MPEHEYKGRLLRLRAAIAIRGFTLEKFSQAIDYSSSHVRGAMLGRREISQELREHLEEALGEDDLEFILGKNDTLRFPRASSRREP